MPLTLQEKNSLQTALRQLVYFLLTIGFILLLWVLADHSHELTFQEGNVVENIQLGLIISSGFIFLAQSYFFPQNRALCFFFAALCFLGTCRELDSFFDSHLPILSWKFAFLAPITALGYAYCHFKEARKSFFYFLTTSAFNMMCLSMFVGLAIAQALGHRPFIEDVLGPSLKSRIIRGIFEEGTESIGYFILFLSSIECFFSLHSSSQKH